jgi:hypothetical protein
MRRTVETAQPDIRALVEILIIVRFGAARVLSRPDLSVITPITSANANLRTIMYGNP